MSHLSADMPGPGPGHHRPVPRAPLGPDPAVPPGPGAGRVAATRGHGGDRRAGRGDGGRGAGHRHLLRHAPHRAGRALPGQRVHQHRLPAGRGGRAARARRGLPRGAGRRDDGRRACSPWRRPSAWPTATGCPASRSTTATWAARAPSPSTSWSTTSGPTGWPTPSRRTGPWSGCAAVGAPRRPSRRRWPPSGRPSATPGPPGRARAGRRGGRLMALTDAPRIITSPPGARRRPHPGALSGHRGLRGPAQGPDHDARGGGGRGRRGQPAGPGRGRLPGRPEVVDAAGRPGDLPGGQRGRERAGDLQGPPADRARPAPAARRGAHRRLRPPGDPGLHLPPGRVRRRPRAAGAGVERGLRPRGGGGGHLRLGLLGRRGRPPGRRRLHLRRGDRPPRVARGQAGLPPHQAAVLPGRHRPVRPAHRGQQRRDHGQPAVDRRSTAGPPSPPWARAGPPGPGCSPCRATCATPGPSSSRWSRRPSGT